MNQKRKLILLILIMVAVICITAGVTLAFLSYTKEGVKENKITAGSITFHYNEDSNQGISLGDALPLSDSAGKTQNKYFDFTITSNNNIEGTIPYTITARKVSNPANELDEQYIKVYLTKVTSGNSESQLLFDTYNHLSTEQHNNHDEEVLWSDSVDANTANYEQRYRLRIWIADTLDFSPEKNQDGTYKEVNGEYVYPNNNKEFSIKLNVYSEAEAGIKLSPGLYNANNELVYTWQQLIDNNLIKVTDGALLAGTNSNRKNLLYGKLVIDDSVTSIGNSALSDFTRLNYVEIPATVTSIGQSAFSSCSSLRSVTFANGSQLTSIGYNAFSGCQNLTSIEIPASVTSIGQSAFNACWRLTSVIFESGSQLTSIGSSAFSSCTGLTSIEIPASVTSIGSSAFSSCASLTSIRIPSAVTSIASNAFEECTGLASIVVDLNNTTYDSRNNSNAIIKTATNELIIGCKNTVIPSSVTKIGYEAFYKCTGLTNIEIPSSVTSIAESAFSGCTGLTSVTFASGSQLTSVGNLAFSNSGLTSIVLPASVTTIGRYIFNNCPSLTSIVIDSGNATYDSRDNSNAIIKTSTNELVEGCKSTVIPSSVRRIGDYAFKNTVLTSIEIPSSVTSIGQSAFENCKSLTSVTFASGSQLASIGIMAFYGCIGLTSIEIPSSVTSMGGSVFNGCTSLTSVTFESGSQLSNIVGYAFKNTALTSIEIPSTVTTIGNSAFYGCKGLTSVTFASESQLASIENSAFNGCTGVASMIIPSGVTTIGSNAFKGINTIYYSGSAANSPWGAGQVISNY